MFKVSHPVEILGVVFQSFLEVSMKLNQQLLVALVLIDDMCDSGCKVGELAGSFRICCFWAVVKIRTMVISSVRLGFLADVPVESFDTESDIGSWDFIPYLKGHFGFVEDSCIVEGGKGG
jgi:hypothetical protein